MTSAQLRRQVVNQIRAEVRADWPLVNGTRPLAKRLRLRVIPEEMFQVQIAQEPIHIGRIKLQPLGGLS